MAARRWPRRLAARSPPIAAPTRRPTATPSIPTWCRPAAFAATAPRRRPSPSNAPWTIWRGCWASSPFEIRRINKVRETDRIESIWKDPSDVEFGSYGIDQCLDLVETALKSGRGLPKPEGDDWLEGTGVALAMLEFGPADRASLGRRDDAPARRHLSPRGRLHRDGQRLDHVAPPDRRLGARHARRATSPSSMATPIRRLTTPAPSPAPARSSPARRLRRPRSRCATCSSTLPAAISAASLPIAGCRTTRSSAPTARSPLAELHAEGAKVGDRFEVRRKAYLSPRTVGFNVQGVRVAVHRVTGEIMTLQSVHAADIGRLDQSRCSAAASSTAPSPWASAGRSTRRWSTTRNGAHGEPGAARLSHPGLRRRAAQRDLLRRHLRQDRAARRQGARRMRHQSRGAGDRQRRRQRDRRALPHLPLTPDRIFDRLGS